MQESLLPLLRCPVTRTALTVKIIKKADKKYNGVTVSIITEAVLYAAEDWIYPVINGIPRLYVEAFLDHEAFLTASNVEYLAHRTNLINKYGALINDAVKKNKRTKESFTREWSVYNYDKDKTWDADDTAMVSRFLRETNESTETLKTKNIFDAGCGNGKLELLIAADCSTVIGMDFSDCFAEAAERNDALNVHFIQGDVQFPPLPFNYFDLVHCSGVLMHTPDAELSFSCIEPTVKDTGKLSVWLYHPRKDFIHNLFISIRRVTSKLPLSFQYYLYLVTVFPVSYCIKRIKGNKQNRSEMMVDILDMFTPEYRSEHTYPEAASWFTKRGFKRIRMTTMDTFGFNIVGEKNDQNNNRT